MRASRYFTTSSTHRIWSCICTQRWFFAQDCDSDPIGGAEHAALGMYHARHKALPADSAGESSRPSRPTFVNPGSPPQTDLIFCSLWFYERGDVPGTQMLQRL